MMKEESIIEVTTSELPYACPPIGAPSWSLHPRVYLPLLQENPSTCPYCGQIYHLTMG